ATLDPGLAMGTRVTNVGVVTWNTTQTASATVNIDVGGMPGIGVLSGAAWHDANFDDLQDAGERPLPGWSVELTRNGQPVQSVLTDANGAYRISGVAPNAASGDTYVLRFRAPGAGISTASLGTADPPYTNGPQQISDIVVISGANLQGLNLPIDPNGVVYDALLRAPIAGATLTLLNAGAGAPLPSTCFDDPAQQGQVTLGGGFYKFDLNFSDAACPSGGSYVIAVAAPGASFTAGYSQIIPPLSTAAAPFSVPACPGTPADALPATAQHCESQPSELAPPQTVPARSAGTSYYVHLALDDTSAPGSSQIFNNHLPLDPVLTGAVTLTKSTPAVNVSRGQLVPYEIVVANQLGAPIVDLSLVDRFPAGFQYVEGSARIDGMPSEPTRNGRELLWPNVGIDAATQRTLALLLAVGAGVNEGEFVNRAQALSSLTGALLSPEATARVRVVPDPTFDCTDVLGKVFDDADRDGVQGRGERGLPGVRVVTARGLVATTDRYGRFHITCAVTPHGSRGSNFVLALDDRTLPSGYRLSTPARLVKRATSGKALRVSFGASIHHVVGLDVADGVFEPDSVQMREHWKPRMDLLLTELRKRPAILRLSYLADLESEKLVEQRVESLKREIERAWHGTPPLTVETEVFWRRGAPAPGADADREAATSGWRSLLPSVDAGPPPILEAQPGAAVEHHLPTDQPLTQWSQDPEGLQRQAGDRIEQREVVRERRNTVKLKDVVPPIRFESGVAKIPASTVQKLREVLDEMRHLDNVRLHLVGHADDQPLSGRLTGVFGDNEGLSRERAGEVAEFIQTALALPAEAISFDWAGDAEPVASNATAEGRAQNRRVEVEVWYDEVEQAPALEEVVVPEVLRRFKVCRTETVCKMRFRDGHARRARVRNLIAPLHYDDESVDVPETFIRQVEQALHNLKDKQHVTVKLLGFSDDAPLTGRAERIYGTQLALSKARAHRVALALKDALALPTAAIASDGLGPARPVASNQTERGRALNRRIEVELWYDDPLQELPDEPQLCPDAAGDEVATRIHEPSFGALAPLLIEDGEAQIPPGYAAALRRALGEVEGKTNARLRFVGFTANERLERRTARVYGDDIGLSTARALRTMERVQAELALASTQVEHEGRGYVHSDDVVNAGFLPGES
ncbi:MAG TPA: OmpA family protein, partial [Myxococcota bacterium]|nr:OmpA family protein [Myxococcota bacterium]